MKLRSVIIDDEETGIETLRLLINKHVEGVKVIGEAIRAAEGITLIEDYMPDIVFLDISMPEMNGFELLENLTWKDFYLVFTTAHQEYALRALKNHAIDYLLKPIDPVDLKIAVDKIKQKKLLNQTDNGGFNYQLLNSIPQFHTNKLGIHSKTGIEFIDPVDIIYLESKSNYTLVYLSSNREILSPKTLKEFELQLCISSSSFMRVHHSFVVNLHKVSRYMKDEENIIMNSNHKIPVSKKRKENFLKWLSQ